MCATTRTSARESARGQRAARAISERLRDQPEPSTNDTRTLPQRAAFTRVRLAATQEGSSHRTRPTRERGTRVPPPRKRALGQVPRSVRETRAHKDTHTERARAREAATKNKHRSALRRAEIRATHSEDRHKIVPRRPLVRVMRRDLIGNSRMSLWCYLKFPLRSARQATKNTRCWWYLIEQQQQQQHGHEILRHAMDE